MNSLASYLALIQTSLSSRDELGEGLTLPLVFASHRRVESSLPRWGVEGWRVHYLGGGGGGVESSLPWWGRGVENSLPWWGGGGELITLVGVLRAHCLVGGGGVEN